MSVRSDSRSGRLVQRRLVPRRLRLVELVFQPDAPERPSARVRLERALGAEFVAFLLALLCGPQPRPGSSSP